LGSGWAMERGPRLSGTHNETVSDYKPPYETLVAVALFSFWIVILSLPMWSGLFLGSTPVSDQFATGYAWRHWQAEQWRALGHIPLWNPDIFGGLPYVAAMHGDIFYPTAWLRLLLPTVFAMDLGFVVHYVLAGLFMYLFVRRLNGSWAGAVVAGLSYQLAGVVASYVHPGHDGKLYVTTLLPLAFLALLVAIRDRKFEGYGLLALTVGLAILSPHPQMAQYMLIAAGFFTLYLVFGEPTDRPVGSKLGDIGLASAAVVVGFLISAIQMLPFWEYIPYSPRAETYRGFAGATSYAIPWVHVPEFFLSGFAGQSAAGTYWGSNPIKLHSEYLGLPVIALAILGMGGERRRLTYWLAGIGALFLLVSLGASTPFYRLWYAVVPFVKQTRAPGMALYVVAFVLAVFAGFGVRRIERREVGSHAVAWIAVGAGVMLLAMVGAFGGMATYLARGIEQATRMSVSRVAAGADSSIMWGAFWSGLALLAVGTLVLAAVRNRIQAAAVCFGLVFFVSADLWRNAREFWVFQDAAAFHSPDQITDIVTATPKPYRVFNANVYEGSRLMTFDIPQLLGYHGNEIHRFDVLLGGKNIWRNQGYGVIWDLFAIEYVVVPAGMQGADSIPGYELLVKEHQTAEGISANLLRRSVPAKYARLVPGALKLPDEQAVATILDPRFPPDRVVLLSPDAPVEPEEYRDVPEPLQNQVPVTDWEPGRMVLNIEPPAPQDSYVLVAENWYPNWQATVDGEYAPVVRGNQTLITVPVPAGASTVSLVFDSKPFRIGKIVTFLSLFVTIGTVVVPMYRRRTSGGV
jgi:hypothetical protein